MRVAICEDEEAQQKLLQNCLMEWAEQNKIMLETKLFPNSECFLFAWEEKKDIDGESERDGACPPYPQAG